MIINIIASLLLLLLSLLLLFSCYCTTCVVCIVTGICIDVQYRGHGLQGLRLWDKLMGKETDAGRGCGATDTDLARKVVIVWPVEVTGPSQWESGHQLWHPPWVPHEPSDCDRPLSELLNFHTLEPTNLSRTVRIWDAGPLPAESHRFHHMTGFSNNCALQIPPH